jgi:hypothetical protein
LLQAQGFFEGGAGLFGPAPLQKKRRGNNAKTNTSALPYLPQPQSQPPLPPPASLSPQRHWLPFLGEDEPQPQLCLKNRRYTAKVAAARRIRPTSIFSMIIQPLPFRASLFPVRVPITHPAGARERPGRNTGIRPGGR